VGSEAAFEAIVARYRRPLMGCLRRLLAEERAEEALQQTFVKAHAAIERGEQVRSLRSWLYRIAHNTAANVIRDNAHPHEPLDDHLGGGERPDQVADRRQTLSEVLSAVQALPIRQRDAIVLRELEGRSYDEIAGELGVTHGAVRALLNRARSKVRSSVTAVTPAGWLVRLVAPLADTPAPARIAELCGAATLSKVCVTALATGAAAGGATPLPHLDRERTVHSRPAAAATAAPRTPLTVKPVRTVAAAAPARLAGRATHVVPPSKGGDAKRHEDAREPGPAREDRYVHHERNSESEPTGYPRTEARMASPDPQTAPSPEPTDRTYADDSEAAGSSLPLMQPSPASYPAPLP
jgi:RNA polymerase sigma factor (sigma-70 family)